MLIAGIDFLHQHSNQRRHQTLTRLLFLTRTSNPRVAYSVVASSRSLNPRQLRGLFPLLLVLLMFNIFASVFKVVVQNFKHVICLKSGIDPATHRPRIDLLDLSFILSSTSFNLSNPFNIQSLVNPQVLRLATLLESSSNQENKELLIVLQN